MSPHVLQHNTKLNYFETYSVNRDQMVCSRGRTLYAKLHPFIGKKKHSGDWTTSIYPKLYIFKSNVSSVLEKVHSPLPSSRPVSML
ncbi:hypothetical protein QTP88_018080 [Uroleucon formosanum]